MHKPVRDLQMNFEPPSDFVGESSSGGRRWVKWLGIGCAGISLILALVMIFGGVKVVSCCSDMVETTKLTIVAEGLSQEFAHSIKIKDFATAYKMTSAEHFQTTKSLEQFTAQFTPHEDLLARSMPVVSGIEALTTSSLKEPQWKVTVRMLPPDGGEMVTMVLKIGGVVADSKDVTTTLEVLDVQVDRRMRDMAVEAPAVAATEFHDLLRSGDYESAYKLLGRELPLGETEDASKMSEEMFKTFIKENESILTLPVIEVVRVDYENGAEASVSLRVGASNKPAALVHYKMTRLGSQSYVLWKVVEFSTQPEPDTIPAVRDEDSAEQEQGSNPDEATE